MTTEINGINNLRFYGTHATQDNFGVRGRSSSGARLVNEGTEPECEHNLFNEAVSPAFRDNPTTNSTLGYLLDRFTGINGAAKTIADDMCDGSLSSDSAYAIGRAVVRTGATTATVGFLAAPLITAGAVIGNIPGALGGAALTGAAAFGAAEFSERAYNWSVDALLGIMQRIRSYRENRE